LRTVVGYRGVRHLAFILFFVADHTFILFRLMFELVRRSYRDADTTE
jgi:hypothetical protein